MPKLYGWVREVVPDSLADLVGIVSGDRIDAINGHPIRDLIDYTFYVADESLSIDVNRQETAINIHIDKNIDEGLGILFGEEPAPFIRGCANKCVFCFIKGLPDRHMPQQGLPLGMRDTLYIKDDDYRYSFLFGNFITLTNFKEHDWQRLEEQRLSPLFVSVHATDPDLRRKMVDGPRAGDILGHIQRLGSMGISVHTQLVLCPGMNDGEQLDRSIRDLAALRPIVQSISAVPVGLTKYNNMLKFADLPTLRSYTQPEGLALLKQVKTWQKQFELEMGTPFVYLSDEWYFLTQKPFPRAKHYDSFAQIENGVGVSRRFLDDWSIARKILPDVVPFPTHITLATSIMAQKIMQQVVDDLNTIDNLTVSLLPVINQFFGPLVTVAGLLCGQDVLDAIVSSYERLDLRSRPAHRIVLLPRLMLNNAGKQFLDDMSAETFQDHIGDQVVFARDVSEIMELITALADDTLPEEAVLIGERS